MVQTLVHAMTVCFFGQWVVSFVNMHFEEIPVACLEKNTSNVYVNDHRRFETNIQTWHCCMANVLFRAASFCDLF